jgi:tetratricopeptide (TPR) repeat protein
LFRHGLELDPTDAALRYWLGAALYAGGDPAGAEREFTEVLREVPAYARAHFSLGAIADARKQRAIAIKRYRTAADLDPAMFEARLRLADDLQAEGRLAEAVVEYERVVKSNPGVAEAWIGGARALIALQRRDAALRWLAEGRQIYPERQELVDLETRLAAGTH